MTRARCEIALDSVEGVRAATLGGADRVELCVALELGGLTPSVGLLEAARAATSLPIFVIVRPRAGDFVLDAEDLRGMVRDIAVLRGAGADGFVFGALEPDGAIDRVAIAELCAAAAPQPVTFHRAFDVSRHLLGSLNTLIELGVPRVLSSGGVPCAADGIAVLRSLVDRAQGRIAILAGGGVRRDNVRRIVDESGVDEVHLSAVTHVDGPMRWRGAAVEFGAPDRGAFERRHTDVDEVRAVVAALRG